MIKKLLDVVYFLIGVIAVWSLLFFGLPFISYGVASAEKTLFRDADPRGAAFISFNGVVMKRNYGKEVITRVAIEPESDDEWLRVEVQSDLKCTLLSVRPKLSSRIFGGGIVYADRVTVWVSSPEEKVLWEKWTKKVEKDYWDYKKAEANKPPEVIERPTCKKIIPPLSN